MLKEILPNKTNQSNKLKFHITQPQCKSNTHHYYHHQMTFPSNHFEIKSFVDECAPKIKLFRSQNIRFLN